MKEMVASTDIFSMCRWMVYVKEKTTKTLTEDTKDTKMAVYAGVKHCKCTWNQYGEKMS